MIILSSSSSSELHSDVRFIWEIQDKTRNTPKNTLAESYRFTGAAEYTSSGVYNIYLSGQSTWRYDICTRRVHACVCDVCETDRRIAPSPENTWTQVKNPAVQQRFGIRAALFRIFAALKTHVSRGGFGSTSRWNVFGRILRCCRNARGSSYTGLCS